MIIYFYFKPSYKNGTVFVKSFILIIIQVIKIYIKNGTVYQTIIEYKNIEMVSQKLYKIKHVL